MSAHPLVLEGSSDPWDRDRKQLQFAQPFNLGTEAFGRSACQLIPLASEGPTARRRSVGTAFAFAQPLVLEGPTARGRTGLAPAWFAYPLALEGLTARASYLPPSLRFAHPVPLDWLTTYYLQVLIFRSTASHTQYTPVCDRI